MTEWLKRSDDKAGPPYDFGLGKWEDNAGPPYTFGLAKRWEYSFDVIKLMYLNWPLKLLVHSLFLKDTCLLLKTENLPIVHDIL